MLKRLHPIAGGLALLTICLFWTSTLMSEIFGTRASITAVKTAIPWGFLVLVPAMAFAGASGFRIGGKWRGALIAAKKRRMPVIAANGVLILIPAALYLSMKAQAGSFDTGFYIVQAAELIAGATNIVLLGLNMRDGLRMTAGRRKAKASQP